MPVELTAMVWKVQSGSSKNGFWSNIILQDNESKGQIELFSKDEKVANGFANLVDQTVKVTFELVQNRFGIQIGQVLSVERV